MGIAPDPQFPERAPQIFERKGADGFAGNRGPLRFEEGIATDTDVPNDFMKGMAQGSATRSTGWSAARVARLPVRR